MLRHPFLCALLCIAASVVAPNLVQTTNAQTVWTGFSVNFSKPDFGDPTLPENQDRITDNVWLTRGANGGIFNIRRETAYDNGIHTAPADTEWATDVNNPGEEIAAENWGDLQFTNWLGAYSEEGSRTLPLTLTSRNAVVHLITDNIYLDFQFTDWTPGGPGGMAYMRATGTLPPPENIGDYNGNNIVDAADYVIWRENLGQQVAMNGDGADGNGNGMVDPGDYDVWRMNFDRVVQGPASGAGQTAAVPEPAVGGLFLLAAVSALSFRRRKQFHD
jgi:hypothetical protein